MLVKGARFCQGQRRQGWAGLGQGQGWEVMGSDGSDAAPGRVQVVRVWVRVLGPGPGSGSVSGEGE